MRVTGKGGPGYNGGPNGNLYITINIIEEGRFKVEGRDVYQTVPLADFEAVLGAEVVVPTLSGRKDFRQDSGWRQGRTEDSYRRQGLPEQERTGRRHVFADLDRCSACSF